MLLKIVLGPGWSHFSSALFGYLALLRGSGYLVTGYV